MKITLGAVSLLSFLVWTATAVFLVANWRHGEPPALLTTILAALACVGVGCECVNRAWDHIERMPTKAK